MTGGLPQSEPWPAFDHVRQHAGSPRPPPQADRQGRAEDFACTFANSELKEAVDAEIERQLATASDLGASDLVLLMSG